MPRAPPLGFASPNPSVVSCRKLVPSVFTIRRWLPAQEYPAPPLEQFSSDRTIWVPSGRSAPSTVETAQISGRSRQSVQKATSRPSGPYDDPATMAPDGGLVLKATRTDAPKTIAPASTTAANTASRGLGRKLIRPLLSP